MNLAELNERIDNVGDEDIRNALRTIVNEYGNQGVSADVIYDNIIKTLENMK